MTHRPSRRWYAVCFAFVVAFGVGLARGLLAFAGPTYWEAQTSLDYAAVILTSCAFAVFGTAMWLLALAVRREAQDRVRTSPMILAGALVIALAIENLVEDLFHLPIGALWIILVLLSFAATLASAAFCLATAGTRLIGGCLMTAVIGDLLGENAAGLIVGSLGRLGLAVVAWRIARAGYLGRW